MSTPTGDSTQSNTDHITEAIDGFVMGETSSELGVARRDVISLLMLTFGAILVQIGIICWVLSEADAATILVVIGLAALCVGVVFLVHSARPRP